MSVLILQLARQGALTAEFTLRHCVSDLDGFCFLWPLLLVKQQDYSLKQKLSCSFSMRKRITLSKP